MQQTKLDPVHGHKVLSALPGPFGTLCWLLSAPTAVRLVLDHLFPVCLTQWCPCDSHLSVIPAFVQQIPEAQWCCCARYPSVRTVNPCCRSPFCCLCTQVGSLSRSASEKSSVHEPCTCTWSQLRSQRIDGEMFRLFCLSGFWRKRRKRRLMMRRRPPGGQKGSSFC